MDEQVIAIDHELRRLFEEANGVTATIRTLGAPETESQASELNKKYNGICKRMREYQQNLKQLADEQDTDEASLQVEELVKEHQLQYEKLRSERESVNAEKKKNVEAVRRKQMQERLFSGASRAQVNDERTAVAATKGITASLRRTQQLMSEQIGATDANTQLIDRKQYKCIGKDQRRTPVTETPVHIFKATAFNHVVLWAKDGCTQKRMLGLTPEFVKSSINGFMSSSFDKAKDYYQHYVQPPILPESPVKPPSFDVDDLDAVEAGDLIKAVREISEEQQHRPQSPELDRSARKEEEGKETTFPNDGDGHLEDHVSSPDIGSRQESEEEQDHQEDHSAAEKEIEKASTERIADPLEEQQDVSDTSNEDVATERSEQLAEEEEPRLVVPTHDETDASQKEAIKGDVDENADEEDEYLDVELEDPIDNKDEL